MSRTTALKKTEAIAVPEDRADLAAAIEAKAKADDAVARQEEAISRASELLDKADAELEAARGKVGPAEEADTKQAATSIRNEVKVSVAWSGAQARGAVRVAEERATLLRQALERLQADLVVLQDEAAARAVDVIAEIKTLVLPVATQLYEKVLADKRRVAVASRVLSELVADDDRAAPKFHDALASIKADGRRSAAMRELQDKVRHLLLLGNSDNATHEATQDALATWRGTLRALQTDPAASLPPVP